MELEERDGEGNLILRCAVQGCASPQINVSRHIYYVLGASRIINCRQCAESRGWGNLRDRTILDQIQQRPRSGGPVEMSVDVVNKGGDCVVNVTAVQATIKKEYNVTTPLWTLPSDAVMAEKMSNLETLEHLLHFMNTAPPKEIMSRESFIKLYHAVYDLLHSSTSDGSHATVFRTNFAITLIHSLMSLWPWWSKLGCDAAIDTEEAQHELVTLYEDRLTDYLDRVRADLTIKRDTCLQCRRSYNQCISDILEKSPRNTLTLWTRSKPVAKSNYFILI